MEPVLIDGDSLHLGVLRLRQVMASADDQSPAINFRQMKLKITIVKMLKRFFFFHEMWFMNGAFGLCCCETNIDL